MVNHPNRSKRLDKDTRLVRARAAEFEAKRQTKPQLSDTRGYEALKALNAELLAALKSARLMLHAFRAYRDRTAPKDCGPHSELLRIIAEIESTIDKAEGR